MRIKETVVEIIKELTERYNFDEAKIKKSLASEFLYTPVEIIRAWKKYEELNK